MNSEAGAGVAPVVVRSGRTHYRTEIEARGHRFLADEPAPVGGTDAGPTPYDYLVAAIGACTAITVRMYADRKGWPLDEVTIRLRHSRVHEADCENCMDRPVGIDQLEQEIEFSGDLTEEQKERLRTIADRCPVKQSLARGIRVVPLAPAGGATG